MKTNQSIKKGTASIFFIAMLFSLSTVFAQQTVQASDIDLSESTIEEIEEQLNERNIKQ